MSYEVAAATGSLLLLSSVVLGAYGRRTARLHGLVSSLERTRTGDVEAGGLVELEGTVRGESTFEAPVSGRDCVLAAWEVEEYQSSQVGSPTTGTWNTIATGVYADPFALDDGSGAVEVAVGNHSDVGRSALPFGPEDWVDDGTVAVHDVVCEFEAFPEVLSHELGEEPERVEPFVEMEPFLDPSDERGLEMPNLGSSLGSRRYSEQVVAPGDDVYLVGHADDDAPTDADPEPDAALGDPDPTTDGSDGTAAAGDGVTVRPPYDGDGLLVLSDRTGRRLEDHLGSRRRVLPLAVALGVLGVAVLVAPLL